MARYDNVPVLQIPSQLELAADDADALAGLLRRRTSLHALCDSGYGHVPFMKTPGALTPHQLNKLAQELRELAQYMVAHPPTG